MNLPELLEVVDAAAAFADVLVADHSGELSEAEALATADGREIAGKFGLHCMTFNRPSPP